jgi:hypothetical protein
MNTSPLPMDDRQRWLAACTITDVTELNHMSRNRTYTGTATLGDETRTVFLKRDGFAELGEVKAYVLIQFLIQEAQDTGGYSFHLNVPACVVRDDVYDSFGDAMGRLTVHEYIEGDTLANLNERVSDSEHESFHLLDGVIGNHLDRHANNVYFDDASTCYAIDNEECHLDLDDIRDIFTRGLISSGHYTPLEKCRIGDYDMSCGGTFDNDAATSPYSSPTSEHGGGPYCAGCSIEVSCITRHRERTQESGSNVNPHRTRHGKMRRGCHAMARCAGAQNPENVSCITEHMANAHIPAEQLGMSEYLKLRVVTTTAPPKVASGRSKPFMYDAPSGGSIFRAIPLSSRKVCQWCSKQH